MSTGKIVEIIGAVIDVEFPRDSIPKVYDALKLGETGRAIADYSRALALDPESKSTRYNIACLYARAGRTDDALDLLENSITFRRWIENDPDLESLRAEPRYRALIARLDP